MYLIREFFTLRKLSVIVRVTNLSFFHLHYVLLKVLVHGCSLTRLLLIREELSSQMKCFSNMV